MEWITYDGRIADTETASHQHISNFIWYHTVTYPMPADYVDHHVRALINRFSSVILPYKPLIEFRAEVWKLQIEGLLQPDPDGIGQLVVYEGNVIGRLI